MPTTIDVFAKAREHERLEQLRAAREIGALPYFHVLEGPTLPVVEMEGQRRIMLGSNNYLGLTGDERVKQGARDALDRYGTGLTGSRFLNGTIDLHVELEQRARGVVRDRRRARLHHRPSGQPGRARNDPRPGDTVIVDSGDHASILDGCLLSQAKIRAFRHNRLDLLEKRLERAPADGGGILVVVDGVYSMEGDVAPLPEIVALCKQYGARLMVDEAHALRRAGGARRRQLRAVRRRGPRRSADGDILQVARVLRRRDRGSRRGDRVPPDRRAAVHLHRVWRAGGRRRGARRRAHLPLRGGPRPVRQGARQRAPTCARACAPSASACSARRSSTTVTTPRSSLRWSLSSSATIGRPCSSGSRSTRPASSSTSRSTRRCRRPAHCCAPA